MTWRQEMETNVVSSMRMVSTLASGVETIANEIEDIKKKLDKRIYLSNSQLMAVKKAVREKAALICRQKGFEYKKSYRFIVQALYRSINGQYNVPSYRDLPELYYNEIIEAIEVWNLPIIVEQRIKAA